ncbi:MAG: hypothetical protein H6707_15910 [Deltaproteobacteria bacterium]|nr:hypothetical protein [Deltaproteobacteria bacterium]
MRTDERSIVPTYSAQPATTGVADPPAWLAYGLTLLGAWLAFVWAFLSDQYAVTTFIIAAAIAGAMVPATAGWMLINAYTARRGQRQGGRLQ